MIFSHALRLAHFSLWTLILGIVAVSATLAIWAQTNSAPRDAKAETMLQNAQSALTANSKLQDVILEGRFSLEMGPPQHEYLEVTGDSEFAALPPAYSEFKFHTSTPTPAFSSGIEICTKGKGGEIIGAWATEHPPLGATTYSLGHGTFTSCWSAPQWFFPALALKSEASDSSYSVIYRGNSSKGTPNLEILRFYQLPPTEEASSVQTLWQNLTVSELYLDQQSSLPQSLVFWVGAFGSGRSLPLPPEDPLSDTNHPVVVNYGDYRKVGGIEIPFSLKCSEGWATLSVTIQKVRLNTGVGPQDFTLPGTVEREVLPSDCTKKCDSRYDECTHLCLKLSGQDAVKACYVACGSELHKCVEACP